MEIKEALKKKTKESRESEKHLRKLPGIPHSDCLDVIKGEPNLEIYVLLMCLSWLSFLNVAVLCSDQRSPMVICTDDTCCYDYVEPVDKNLLFNLQFKQLYILCCLQGKSAEG